MSHTCTYSEWGGHSSRPSLARPQGLPPRKLFADAHSGGRTSKAGNVLHVLLKGKWGSGVPHRSLIFAASSLPYTHANEVSIHELKTMRKKLYNCQWGFALSINVHELLATTENTHSHIVHTDEPHMYVQ